MELRDRVVLRSSGCRNIDLSKRSKKMVRNFSGLSKKIETPENNENFENLLVSYLFTIIIKIILLHYSQKKN